MTVGVDDYIDLTQSIIIYKLCYNSTFYSSSFSLSTPVPACTVICEDPLPIAHNDSKMTLKEVIPLKPNWAKDYNKKVDAQETFNEQKHLFRYDILSRCHPGLIYVECLDFLL